MTKPFRFEKAGPRTYTVIATADQAVLGSVDRLSPDHATLSPKWRAIVLDGPDAGSHHRTRDAAAQAIVDRIADAAAAVLAEPDPEYAHRGDGALIVLGARGDDAALVELDRRRAAERAAWNAQYARGNKPADGADVVLHGTEAHGEVAAAPPVLRDEVIVHDLSGVFARLAAAAAPPRRWTVTFTETVTHRAVVELPDLPDGDDYPDRQAAALLDLARDAIGDGAVFVSSSAAFVQADPLPELPETLWLCGECYEQLSRGDLAQCEDGCSQSLDHTGACHPREHAGETCTRCGEVGRLTSYDSDNLDCEEYDELVALLALPGCPWCGGRHGVAQACGGPEDQDPGPWEAPTSLAPAELARLRAVADRARETGAARSASWAVVDTDGSVSDRYTTQEQAEAALPGHPAGHTVEHVPDPGAL